MNREIKFRGKRADNDEWIFGGYMKNKNGTYISDTENYHLNASYKHYLVDSETVCQYTGLKDKNGKEIYDGDLIRYKNGGIEEIDEVFFDNEYGTFEIAFNRNKSNSATLGFWIADLDEESSYEIIGNIYEREEENE